MVDRAGSQKTDGDPVLIGSLLIPAVLFPLPAYAVQVGCFVTALLLGAMFLVGLGFTAVAKHLLARYVWKVAKTPWLRMFGLTWIELLLGIIVFAVVRTSYWLTVAIYFPAASLVNRALLAKVSPPPAEAPSFLSRNGIFLLLPLALPVSIQIAGVLWNSLTNMITFTEIR
jgi:hypothetical protein